tara:strand:+ start:10204 stop:10818 length:615 start_codon:yes stop_codon:yes gene_type:complete
MWKDFFNNEIIDNIFLNCSTKIYPERENIYKCFELCTENNIKVIIIGQDCYHQPNQATGLCFAVPHNSKIPPSLRNIKKEIETDIGNMNSSIDLISWAEQGVLLLNSSLTVEHGKPGSHIKYWENFTNNIIKKISDEKSELIFCLWGKYAQKKQKLINPNNNHYVLCASHPSPLSANRGGWFGNRHFSSINKKLISINKEPIIW